MDLILARHGNTFQSGQPVVWVGSQNDLPLVDTGRQQALQLAQWLSTQGDIPDAMYSGPLLRMTEYAKILLHTFQQSQLNIDLRLNEIDYGLWSGLTTQEVCDRFGQDQFEKWERQSEWPERGSWGESDSQVKARICDFGSMLTTQFSHDDKILVVASNGCLRYFLHLIPNEFKRRIADQTIKIATGKACKMTFDGKAWGLRYWNSGP